MKKGLVMVLAVTFLAVASTVSAQTTPVFGEGKAQVSFGLTQFTAHTVDTLLFGDNNDPFLSDNGLLGFGGEFRYGLSERWALALGGFFGFGSDKGDFASDGKSELNYSAFGLRLGVDHTFNLNNETGLYMGPGFEFASAKSKVKDNSNFSPAIDEDNNRTTTMSLDARVGVIHKLGENVGLNGSMGKKWSYVKSSYDTDFGAGPEEAKITRWTSSVNGWIGLAFMF